MRMSNDAEEEQLLAADELNHVMDFGMDDLKELTRYLNKGLEKLSHLEKAAWKETDMRSARIRQATKKGSGTDFCRGENKKPQCHQVFPFSCLTQFLGNRTEGGLNNVAEDVSSSPIQPLVFHDPTLSLHERDHATEDGKAQGDVSERKTLNGTQNEMTTNVESFVEKSTNLEFDRDDLDAVIQEAKELGLQIIKNADLEELRELGSGHFGTVYHGKWRGADVAIKRIKNSCFVGKSSGQDRPRSDFWREARILADSHHPNVVAFYGVVPDGPEGTLAIVTEYMVNGSVKQILQKKANYRGIDQRKRLKISMDAACGMEYLHLNNIVHFDLKCDNLFVNINPQGPICKVGDLGLSKIKHQTLVSGSGRGTLPWMAPELFRGSSNMVSEKIDVFSFGILMWELLTGKEPYTGMHRGEIIGGIVLNTLRPPIPSNCDPAWRFLMERCWSEDPSARPTFTEISNSLRSMESSLPPEG